MGQMKNKDVGHRL